MGDSKFWKNFSIIKQNLVITVLKNNLRVQAFILSGNWYNKLTESMFQTFKLIELTELNHAFGKMRL